MINQIVAGQRVLFLLGFLLFVVQKTSGQCYLPNSCPTVCIDTNCLNSAPNYVDAVYQYEVHKNLLYSRAAIFGGTVDDLENLYMDVYVPCNRDTSRPLVIFAGISGYSGDVPHKNSRSNQYRCIQFAKRGYVAISLDTRGYHQFQSVAYDRPGDTISNQPHLGPFRQEMYDKIKSNCCGYGMQEYNNILIEMFYKLAQDGRAAIRYVYKNLLDPLQIDSNFIFVSGTSSGADWANLTAYADDVSDFENFRNSDDVLLNYDNKGNSLSDDFGGIDHWGIVPASERAFRQPTGVIHYFGQMMNRDMVDPDDPVALILHSPWDKSSRYQIDNRNGAGKLADPESVHRFGGESLFCKTLEHNIHSKIINICNGKHVVFKIDANTCMPQAGFDSIISFSINQAAFFIRDLMLNNSHSFNPQQSVSRLRAISQPWIWNPQASSYRPNPSLKSPRSFGLPGQENWVLIDNNNHCPGNKEEHSCILYDPVRSSDISINSSINSSGTIGLLNDTGTLGNHPINNNEIVFQLDLGATLKVFPNPIDRQVTVTIELQEKQTVQIQLYSALGQKIKHFNWQQTMEFGNHRIPFPSDQLPSGIYFLKYDIANQSRIIKLRKL